MIKNPLFWAGLLAILFLIFKRDELAPVAPGPAVPKSTPVSVPAPATPALVTTQIDHSEWREDFEAASAALPLLTDIARLDDEETHHMRELNNRLGQHVGFLAEKANRHPARREETLRFFLQCAENAAIIPSARALCWWKLTNKINEWKVFIPLSDAKVPLDVQRLAASINPEKGT